MHDLWIDERVQLSPPEETGEGEAQGKAILLGEHFVVHGAPALAVPISGRRVRVTVAPGPGPWRCEPGSEPHLRAMVARLGLDPARLTLEVESSLPIGMGLGSSAALAVALLRALGVDGLDRLMELAHDLEHLAHGNPSGVDAAVATLARPVWFARGAPTEPLACPGQLPLLIATSPREGSTQLAVAHVQRWSETHPDRFASLLVEAGHDAWAARSALVEGDWDRLGGLLDRAHARLDALGVTTAGLDRLCAAARGAGALGAKLTGAGLGGAVLVLAHEPLDVTRALLQAGALEVFPA